MNECEFERHGHREWYCTTHGVNVIDIANEPVHCPVWQQNADSVPCDWYVINGFGSSSLDAVRKAAQQDANRTRHTITISRIVPARYPGEREGDRRRYVEAVSPEEQNDGSSRPPYPFSGHENDFDQSPSS